MSKILGVKIDPVSFSQAINKIQVFLTEEGLHQIATVNPEFVMKSLHDKKFKEVLNQTSLSVADGFGMKCAAWYLGQKIGERITGIDLTWEICKVAAENNYSVYFLGAAEGVAEKAAFRVRLLNPNLKIAGTYAGSPSEKGIVERINASGADILFVAYGAPKQDKFIAEHKTELKVKLAMGVGGTFDYIVGIVPYAPVWMRKCGLEWFYRLIVQPKRWKRILTATVLFPLAVIFSRFIKQN